MGSNVGCFERKKHAMNKKAIVSVRGGHMYALFQGRQFKKVDNVLVVPGEYDAQVVLDQDGKVFGAQVSVSFDYHNKDMRKAKFILV